MAQRSFAAAHSARLANRLHVEPHHTLHRRCTTPPPHFKAGPYTLQGVMLRGGSGADGFEGRCCPPPPQARGEHKQQKGMNGT